MRRTVVAAALVCATAGSARAEEPTANRLDHYRRTRLTIAGIGILTYVASETVLKGPLSPEPCRWCGGNDLDDHVRDAVVWKDIDLAHALSNLTGFVLAPLSASGLLLVSSQSVPRRWTQYVDDMIPVIEAATYSALFAQAVKFSTGRARPFVRFRNDEVAPDVDDNVSFFSGHTTLAFGIAVGAGTVAHRRGYRQEPVVWAVGLTLAAATGYLRMAADRHYVTDVATGAVVGTLAGLLVPRISGALPDRVVVTPTGRGAAVVGVF